MRRVLLALNKPVLTNHILQPRSSKLSTEPTTDIYDSWNVEVPALIRGLLLKNKVFSPEDLAGATIGKTSGKKFNQLQQLKKDLGIELLEPLSLIHI